MATWDTADLLAECKRLAGIPDSTEYPADSDWYTWLTRAQDHWMRELSAHVPEANYCAPTQLTTSDSGETYQFPNPYGSGDASSVFAVELYDRKDGSLLTAGAYWDLNADYVFEGNQIRFPLGKTRTFTNGPYARYVAAPSDIDDSTEPVLKPASARILLPFRAVAYFMDRGGVGDPEPFFRLEDRHYYGVPERGIIGILASLKAGDTFGGVQAFQSQYYPWYKGIDTGGYIP